MKQRKNQFAAMITKLVLAQFVFILFFYLPLAVRRNKDGVDITLNR